MATNGDPSGQPNQLVLHKIYVKDLSFENPASPAVFQRSEWSPQIEFNCQTSANRVSEGVYEVVLSATVTAKHDESVLFLVEVQQAGLFQIALAGDNLKYVLGATCPGILYPYAREAVSNLVTRGGYPQLLLNPVDFDAMYRAHESGAGTAPSQ